MVVSRWHGLKDDASPIDRAREYLTVLRQALSGGPVSHDGPVYSVTKARLSGVGAERTPAMALGAMNPMMLGLAGELADAAILNYVSADAVPELTAMVRAGEERAGRPAGSCAVSCFVHVGVGDAGAARTANRRDLFGYSMAPGYRRSFRRHGFGDEMDRLEAALPALEKVPEGARIAVAVSYDPSIWGSARLSHAGSYATVYRDALVNTHFAIPGVHMLQLKGLGAEFIDPSQRVAVKPGEPIDLSNFPPARYADYLWFIGDNPVGKLPAGTKVLYRAPGSMMAQLAKPESER